MTTFRNHNEMITAVKNFMQANILQDYSIKIEKTTYRNGDIFYHVEMKQLEKYRI